MNIFDNELTKKELTAYISQDCERHNFLMSIIIELKHIKQKFPTISYTDAINKSKYYKCVFDHLNHRYISKFKCKIAYFWYLTYENKDFNL